MYDMLSTNLERYARDRYADLLAESEKARLIKEALVCLTPRQASQIRDLQFKTTKKFRTKFKERGE